MQAFNEFRSGHAGIFSESNDSCSITKGHNCVYTGHSINIYQGPLMATVCPFLTDGLVISLLHNGQSRHAVIEPFASLNCDGFGLFTGVYGLSNPVCLSEYASLPKCVYTSKLV